MLIGASLLTPAAVMRPAERPASRYSDLQLYRNIVDRVAAGQDYYVAAASELRTHHYPTYPWAAFRQPWQSMLLAALRTEKARWLAVAILAIAAIGLSYRALAQANVPLPRRMLAIPLIGAGLAAVASPASPYLHETWSGILILASLACWRPGRLGVAVVLGVAACLIRETALPYPTAMLAFVIFQRRWTEARAWAVGMAIFGAALAFHIHLASQQHHTSDLASNGWLKFGGWSFIIAMAHVNPFLDLLPAAGIALVVGLSILGFASADNEWMTRVGATVGAFLVTFACVGRPDNSYWGLLYAPLLPLGLVYADRAVGGLMRAGANSLRQKAAIPGDLGVDAGQPLEHEVPAVARHGSRSRGVA